MRALVGIERTPIGHRRVPGLALGGLRPILQVGEGLVVRCHEPGPRSALDRHVADRHAAFHGQRPDGFARIFDDMAGAARRADLADDGQDDVLGRDTRRKLPVDLHQHVLGLGLDQRLRGQNMLDLAGADAVRECSESAMCGRMAVAADDRRSGKREALFRPDDVNDTLAGVEFVEIFDAERAGVFGQRLDLHPAFGFLDAAAPICGLNVVIDDRQGLTRRSDGPSGDPQALEGLRARDLVHEMTIDVEEASTVRLAVDDVIVPDLVVKCSRRTRCSLNHGVSPWRCRRRPAGRTGFGSARLAAVLQEKEVAIRRPWPCRAWPSASPWICCRRAR